MVKKIGIVFTVLLLIAALLFGIWYLTKIYHWPLWVGAVILAGTIGVVLAIVFIRRYLLRNNERKFVKRVIAQEGDALFATQESSSILINDLQHKWEKSIETLYASTLNDGKNAIYALPWILVIGESGAGKTTLIKNSRLSSAVTDVDASAQYAGTKNCDWWFFEDAIILDTAGRYAIPLEEKKDNAEWERFLSLLSKYRKEEPLNGLVITISVERLLENDKDIIQTDALSIRKRINQLMLTVGVKFPVYIMITKMDHVYGFTDFCETLPEALRTQAMGYLNETLVENWDEVIDEALTSVKEKITSLQLRSIQEHSKKTKEILLFSKEFDQITPALKAFVGIVFGDNPYQKIPLLRGIYFSSALSDGEGSSKFLSDFELPQKSSEANTNAYFIRDFFKVILPKDRNVYTPIQEYLSWQKRNYKIAIAAWVLLFTSLFGVYFYSYIQNINVITDVKYIEKHAQSFDDMGLTARIIALDKLRLDIEKVQELNENVLLPFLKFDQSYKAESNLKELYRKEFYDGIYREYRLRMQDSIEKITYNTPAHEVVSYVGFLIDSIDILDQVLDDKEEIKVSQHLFTWIKEILSENQEKIDPSVALLFLNEYIAFQSWQERSEVHEQIKEFKGLISSSIEKKGDDLHWLTDEGVSQTQPVQITDFIKDVDHELAEEFPIVSGSLTAKGRENLISNIKILEDVMSEDLMLKKNLRLFWQWYDDRFYYRWKNFAVGMTQIDKLLRPKHQDELIYTMSSEENPYFELIHTMAKEFKAYKSLSKTPEWTLLVIDIDKIISLAKEMRNSKNSLLSKVTDEKNSLLANAEAKIDQNAYAKQIRSATLFNQYLADLSKLSVVVDKRESMIVISEFFSDTKQPSKSAASLNSTQEHYKKFIHSLIRYPNTDFIYKLLAAPKEYILDHAMYQLQETLNSKWESDVLSAIPLSSDHDLLMSMFNEKKGLVWKYVNGTLKPFVKRNRYGYSAKTVHGYTLQISPSFLRYINSGINLLSVYKPKYDISIQTLPFDINEDAKRAPDYVDLHLRCAKSDYDLKNENYKLTKVFSWVPNQCGDTVITFGFRDFKVQKSYRGENGFLHFLKAFRTGTKAYKVSELDEKIPELEQNNIKYIVLSYNISGEDNILRLLDKTPYKIPKKVVGSK